MIRSALPTLLTAVVIVALPAMILLEHDPPSESTTVSRNPQLPDNFIEKRIQLPDRSEWKYVVYIPPQYNDDPHHNWPVIVFLHGSAESGTDNIRQTQVGLPAYIRQNISNFPFIVIMPQARGMWFRGQNALAVWSALDTTLREYRTDRDRVTLTGLSMGGFGTWELATLQPDAFAAIIPVCGVAPVEYLSNIRELPVWAFHGSQDQNVPVSATREAVARLRELGAEPKYTEYAGQGHKIWDNVYSSKEVWKWVLRQKRKPAPRAINYRLIGANARVWWLIANAEPDHVGKARIHAEIDEENRITISTEGVHSWAIISQDQPIKPGDIVSLTHNNEKLFRGRFNGMIGYNISPASQPSDSPADRRGARPPHRNSTTPSTPEIP
ncbi:MAG: prolyl oligopeptidase family serine peptidase [Phycisphaerae bacterium]|nr:prolyl oligopeptidase family serine peptidase [Phycisphaerae bacterium]